ncbi:styrene monooxygenase/indole monooxygenase family protein [Cytobacillus purgationiresistens]|uniref:Styrene monooxygenase StyA putative substrate binding domain-containing protein n=1 Tax=Cytobacillus purgationiresistens TaxID=863449 RepID=A0ABU0AH05_9BACI|nr:styrene monooxygenase/indole monooxygenase family protein [Cytobacillus purgationiresistens]MDQ0270539.1 hypothetical protein [Cytobacillus purgationiresistens]
MKKRLGLIGSGVSGLHLAYALKDEFDITVIERQASEKMRDGRIMSTQVHFGPTRAREERFHVPKWGEQPLIESIHITLGDKKLFVCNLQEPALSIDQRLYYYHSVNDLIDKGVDDKVDKESAERLVDGFDLVVDCTGKNGPLFPFPIEEALSPLEAPQRKCIVGYFKGIKSNLPLGVSVAILPEEGEMFEIPALTELGPVTILFIMAIPNGDLDVFKGVKDAVSFSQTMRNTVQQFFPDIHSRVEEHSFELCDEKGFLQTV